MNNTAYVAYVFLIYDVIIRYDIWNDYFNNKENYIVIIHNKFDSKKYEYLYKFKYIYTNNKIDTINKTHINIVKAILLLIKQALLFKNITHIVFLSGSCIPLYKYDILNNIIINSKYSIIDCKYNNCQYRYNNLSLFIKKFININKFAKQQPNMILIRNDAIKFIENDYTYDFSNIICPDEHYFINIALYLFKIKIIIAQINFCNFDINKTQALEYINIDDIFLNKIRKQGFLFMRKVIKNSYITPNLFF